MTQIELAGLKKNKKKEEQDYEDLNDRLDEDIEIHAPQMQGQGQEKS